MRWLKTHPVKHMKSIYSLYSIFWLVFNILFLFNADPLILFLSWQHYQILLSIFFFYLSWIKNVLYVLLRLAWIMHLVLAERWGMFSYPMARITGKHILNWQESSGRFHCNNVWFLVIIYDLLRQRLITVAIKCNPCTLLGYFRTINA